MELDIVRVDVLRAPDRVLVDRQLFPDESEVPGCCPLRRERRGLALEEQSELHQVHQRGLVKRTVGHAPGDRDPAVGARHRRAVPGLHLEHAQRDQPLHGLADRVAPGRVPGHELAFWWQLLSRLEHAAGQVAAQSLSDFLAELLVCHGVSVLAG